MSYETPGEIYSAIADAIRDVEDSSNPIPFKEFPDRIMAYNLKIPLRGYTGSTWECAVIPYARAGTATDLSYMFYELPSNSGTIDLTKIEPANVTSMSHMFDNADINTVNLSNLGTSSLTNMSYMFHMSRITTLIVENMDTSHVTNMSHMFDAAIITNEVGFSSWDVSSVTNMGSAFESAAIDTLNLSGWDVSSVTYMAYTFDSRLINILDLSGWDTSSVQRMDGMFYSFEGIAWLPSTFVATNISYFGYDPFYNFHSGYGPANIYTDATDARTQGWGSIDPARFIIHYNSTYQDFLDAISQ